MEIISIKNLMRESADITLDSSLINTNNLISQEIESTLGSKLEGALKTEILLAEVFIGQIVLMDYLQKHNQEIKNVDHYMLNVYQLLVDKHRYFDKDGLVIFESLIQSRYPEYYSVVKKNDNITKPITDLICKNFQINNIFFLLF